MGGHFKILTFGCQMNVYDSGLLRDLLVSSGWQEQDDLKRCDLVLLNTCSVRQKAETRVFGRLGALKTLKDLNPDMRIVVAGCMAQRLGQKIIEKMPHVDAVIGTDRLFELPGLLQGSLEDRVMLDVSGEDFGELPLTYAPAPNGRRITAFVAISRGCENFCSYCIVPYVRGNFRCRTPGQIIEEIQRLVEGGLKEVTLLGQNVNSYQADGVDFPALLRMVARETDVRRVRFTTSHPKDFSVRLAEVMAEEPKVCEALHLPLQSGSDVILRRMNRKYSMKDYLEKIQAARRLVPELTLTTDLIAGFPGETVDDFEATLAAVREIRFDSAFTFRYSVREGTAAARLSDDVPEKEKIRRLNILIDVQRDICREVNAELVGRTVEVLVEGPAKHGQGYVSGKTGGGKTVVVEGDADTLLGEFVDVRIESADAWTLRGRIVDRAPVSPVLSENHDLQA